MGYVRITIYLQNAKARTGIRHFPDSEDLEAIRAHAFKLSAEVLGRGAIRDVAVEALAADDPGVVSLILRGKERNTGTERATGEHPFSRDQHRRPLH
jgi:hypothetical protein